MKNTLIEDYLYKLKNYKFTSYRQEQIANELSKELPQANSIKELRNLLSDYLELIQSGSSCCSVLTNLIPVSIYSFFTSSEETTRLPNKRGQARDLKQLLEGWLDELNALKTSKKLACKKLDKMPFQNKAEPLMILIRELLNNPQALMHQKIPSLIKELNSSDLESALENLAKLPNSPKLTSRRRGDFSAQAAIYTKHTGCFALLADNSAVYNDKDKLLTLTNSLLQEALIIYKDLHTEEATATQSQIIEEQARSYGHG
ncbi:hypothetical protein Lnau_0253 [Legionella nautarum]|uniref:Uncharacterized protein n=1 Tax=Legionella nautarum TaxID=45070 RepID=A0A0W0X3K6_9GAMM|nr:hypothetical protein [Legionella nautarum]KTD39184.1 hypothetical protein Lnau_0253 [Legionella nautarum]